MKGIANRLKRGAVLTGIGALVAGAAVLGSTSAHAATIVGTQLGGITISPASGAVTATGLTYSSTACPSGNNGSAVVRLVDPAAGQLSNLTAVNNSVTSAFTGTFNTTFATQQTIFSDLGPNTTAEIVVDCFSGASTTGTSIPVQYTFVTFDATGANYTISNNGPAQGTTTTLTANPNPAINGNVVNFTATVSPSSATGTVQFQVGGTAINSPVTVTNGVATTAYTFSGITTATTENISAVYTPSGNFTGSTGTLALTVNPAPANSGTIPLAVTVPSTGAFSLNVNTTSTVTLAVNGATATAATTPVVVTDTRNTFPGWSVSGQSSSWAGSGTAAGATIAADQLGWAPTSSTTPLTQGVTLGGTVAPGTTTNGLGDAAQVLASVHAGNGNGYGTTTLGANLTLAIPAAQAAGAYSSGLNITSVTTNP